MISFRSFFVFISLFLTTFSLVASEITIGAAMSLKGCLTEMKEAFIKDNPTISPLFNFSASGTIKMQIEQGAPVDLFISANKADVDQLVTKKLIDSSLEMAKNRLVLVAPKGSTLKIKKLSDIKEVTNLKLALGMPEIVPAGLYAKEVLTKEGLYEPLKEKLIFGQNVKQVLDYVEKKEVSLGFVFATDAQDNKNITLLQTIDEKLHTPIIYGMGIVTSSKKKEETNKWVSFLQSEKGKVILKKFGFQI